MKSSGEMGRKWESSMALSMRSDQHFYVSEVVWLKSKKNKTYSGKLHNLNGIEG